MCACNTQTQHMQEPLCIHLMPKAEKEVFSPICVPVFPRAELHSWLTFLFRTITNSTRAIAIASVIAFPLVFLLLLLVPSLLVLLFPIRFIHFQCHPPASASPKMSWNGSVSRHLWPPRVVQRLIPHSQAGRPQIILGFHLILIATVHSWIHPRVGHLQIFLSHFPCHSY